jgi:rSAM/selenodomain-associated transferase 1
VQSERRLIVFVRAPRAGAVKTRLAQKIGANAACDAYQKLVRAVLNKIDSIPEVQLRYSPDDAESEVRPWLRPSWILSPQGAGDLGERLTRAFAESFGGGASRVLIIGSDCPWLNDADIKEAWNDLETHDLVLGPAKDGGYWLIGLREPKPELFTGISWSTGMVLEQTVKHARAGGLQFRLLRELRDVDTLGDWYAFLRDNSFA